MQNEEMLQKRFAQMAQETAAKGQPVNMADQLDSMAQFAMSTGNLNQASEIANKAALVRGRMAQLAMRNLQMQSPHEGGGDGGGDDSAMLDLVRMNSIEFRNKRLALLQKEQELREAHRQAREKAGGKVVGAPSRGEVDESMMRIKKAFNNLPDDEVASNAYTVASRARALRQANPGLDAATSMSKAMAELNLQNPPSMLDRVYKLFNGVEAAHEPAADSGVLPLPQDKAALVVGKQYSTARGVGEWTGQGFRISPAVQQKVQSTPTVPGLEADDSTDDGEE
jgi:hypothetical protein